MYIYQQDGWLNFRWDNQSILQKLGEVRNAQGRILGKMGTLGFEIQNQEI